MVTEVADYIDKVLEKFPILSKSELNKIITFGLKRYVWVNKQHCDILFKNLTEEPMTTYCGILNTDSLKHFIQWCTKWRMKERVLYVLKRKKWDGYYYIGLTDELHKIALKYKNRYLKNIYFTKVKNELHHLKNVKHIWKVSWPSDCGWKFLVDKIGINKLEYVEENNYGKYHQCFYRGTDE